MARLVIDKLQEAGDQTPVFILGCAIIRPENEVLELGNVAFDIGRQNRSNICGIPSCNRFVPVEAFVGLPSEGCKGLVETDKATGEESSLSLHHCYHKNLLHIDSNDAGIAWPHLACIIQIVMARLRSICVMDGLNGALLAFCQGMGPDFFPVLFCLLAHIAEICQRISKRDGFGSELLRITLI